MAEYVTVEARNLAPLSSLPKDPATGRTAEPYLDVALEGLRVLTYDQ